MSVVTAPSVASAQQTLAELAELPKSTVLPDERIRLCRECLESVAAAASTWVRLEAAAKDLAEGNQAESILSGPVVVLRQLQLSIQTLSAVASGRSPVAPGAIRRTGSGPTTVSVFPTAHLYDGFAFKGITADVRMQPNVGPDQIHGDVLDVLRSGRIEGIALVLGAGNVSSTPATDALNKILFEGRRVLLKLNPVNEYLSDVLAQALAPLISAGLLRLVTGGGDVGAALVEDDRIAEVHITGATQTHDAIVWGRDSSGRRQQNQPLIQKPVTSELGNVTPWIIVPGNYSGKQLQSQANHVAASITNNVSFNCLASKMIVTSQHWEQRDEFLNFVQLALDQTPLRKAYYPGAADRYEQFVGTPAPENERGQLPWTLLRDQNADDHPLLFEEESFVCVCAETALSESHDSFLPAAVEFVNERMFGTLSASLTVPDSFQKSHRKVLDHAVANLRYGSVCINQWSGLAYALISPPWGAWPGSTLDDVQSGIGSVHNTYLLDQHEKTVLKGPLTSFPRPVWFASHRNAEGLARQLLKLYHQPGLMQLARLSLASLKG